MGKLSLFFLSLPKVVHNFFYKNDTLSSRYNTVIISWYCNIPILYLYRHILLVENLPREMRARAKRGDQEMGITCISFNKEDNTNFLIGSESGGVFRCSTSTRGAPASRMY